MNVRARHQLFAPGELPLVILAIAQRRPITASELLAELGRLFGPTYRPSPGGVYPAVTALLDEGLLRASQERRAKRYTITGVGRSALAARRPQLAAIECRTGARFEETDELRELLLRFTDQVMQLAGRLDLAAVESALAATFAEFNDEMRTEHGQKV